MHGNVLLWCVEGDEGVHCLANNQLEEQDAIRDALDIEDFLYPFLMQQYSKATLACVVATPVQFVLGVFAFDEASLVTAEVTRKSRFLETAKVDSSSTESLHHLSILSTQGANI